MLGRYLPIDTTVLSSRRDFDGMPAGTGVIAAGTAGNTVEPAPGALANGAKIDLEELDVPRLVYLVDSGDTEPDTGEKIWLAYFKIDQIPEAFDGQEVLCYGMPSKHVFNVHKRITA